MSDLIPGKRYRWTVEGVGAHKGTALVLSDGTTVWDHVLDVNGTLEELPDPLPTTAGSVVRGGGMTYMRLSSDYGMPWVDSANECWDDRHLAGATVLFDAGADQ